MIEASGVPSFRRKTAVLSTVGRPAPRWPPGDLREIADVEPGDGNNRAVGTAVASRFLNSDAPRVTVVICRGRKRLKGGMAVAIGITDDTMTLG